MAATRLDTRGTVCHSGPPVRSDSTTQAAQPQGIDLRAWAGSRLSLDYTFQYDTLARFYAGNPAEPEAWRAAIARAQAHPRDRARVVAAVQAQLESRNAPAEARAAAARLADPRTVAIVTGQQAGLFGGPLYTLLKGLSAAKLAAEIESTYGTPCVAVYWNHAEDHDWDEVASAVVLDADLQPRTLTVEGITPDNRPVGWIALPDDVTRVVDELAATLPRTEFTDEVLAQVRKWYAPGAGMADAFGHLIDALLGPLGVIVFDGSDPSTKPVAAPLFQRELADPGHSSALATQAGEALVAQGYHAQVVLQPDATALFRLDEHGRVPIRRREGQLVVDETPLDIAALRDDAVRHPERFSPNVLLRAIVQDTIFPTIAYVSGPSELAYLGQLAPVYEFHETPMPLIVPRATGTMMDAASMRFLARTSLDLRSLQAQDEHVLNAWIDAQLPPELDAALRDLEDAVAARMETLASVARAIDPTLDGAVSSSKSKLSHEVRTLHTKVIQASKRRHDTLRRQFTHVQHLTFPSGTPQERIICLAWYMNRFGPALVPRLYETLPLDGGKHWLFQI